MGKSDSWESFKYRITIRNIAKDSCLFNTSTPKRNNTSLPYNLPKHLSLSNKANIKLTTLLTKLNSTKFNMKILFYYKKWRNNALTPSKKEKALWADHLLRAKDQFLVLVQAEILILKIREYIVAFRMQRVTTLK